MSQDITATLEEAKEYYDETLVTPDEDVADEELAQVHDLDDDEGAFNYQLEDFVNVDGSTAAFAGGGEDDDDDDGDDGDGDGGGGDGDDGGGDGGGDDGGGDMGGMGGMGGMM